MMRKLFFALAACVASSNAFAQSGPVKILYGFVPGSGGDLLARIEHLRKTLEVEGLFHTERKKPLPFMPRVVGLITGRDTDALKDVVINARRRWPATRFEVRERDEAIGGGMVMFGR